MVNILKGKTWEEFFGKEKSDQMKEKIREKMIGRAISEKTLQRLRDIGFKAGYISKKKGRTFKEMYGEKRALEINKKHSESKKKYFENNSVWNKGLTKETHPSMKTISDKLKGRKPSQETREKIREARHKQKPIYEDTVIEQKIQASLNKRNISYKTHHPIMGQPDIVFPELQVAVFLDGCYWHACQKCGFNGPMSRPESRDKEVTSSLESQGWTVLRYWEHEIMNDTEMVVDEILKRFTK